MKTSTIVITVLVILLLYIIIKWLTSKVVQLSYKKSTSVVIPIIKGSKLGKEQGANFTYSVWIYISNWNNSDNKKIILQRKKNAQDNPEFEIALDKFKNKLITTVHTNPGTSTSGENKETCTVEDIGIQRWVNIIISVYGKTLDTYINGKLERTCILDNIVKVDPTANLYLGPLASVPDTVANWNGWISNARYYMYYVNPQEAWNIYKEGYGSGGLGGLFDKYKIRFDFLVDDQVKTSFMI